MLGTGKTLLQPPSIARECLRKLGMQLEVMDTVGEICLSLLVDLY